MRALIASSIVILLASPLVAADAAREVSVRVLDAKQRPVGRVDVLLCPLGADKCFEAATTDAKGIARFQKAPREIVFARIMPTTFEMCGMTQERVDLRADDLAAVTMHLPPRGNLGVRLLEHQEGGSPKPLRTKDLKVRVRPSPAQPNNVGLTTYWPKTQAPSDRFEVCVTPGGGYDIEVEIPGFYLGSAHAKGPAEDGTTEVPITIRRKPVH